MDRGALRYLFNPCSVVGDLGLIHSMPSKPACAANAAVDLGTPNSNDSPSGNEQPAVTAPPKRYRHAAAVHSRTRPSCLSHDSDKVPSFLGFRNLLVLVVGGFGDSLGLSVYLHLVLDARVVEHHWLRGNVLD